MWSMLLLIIICASLMSGILMLAACRLGAFADACATGPRDEFARDGAVHVSG